MRNTILCYIQREGKKATYRNRGAESTASACWALGDMGLADFGLWAPFQKAEPCGEWGILRSPEFLEPRL